MPSMTPPSALSHPALILVGLVLSMALIGCHTDGNHGTHHHHHGHRQLAPSDSSPEKSEAQAHAPSTGQRSVHTNSPSKTDDSTVETPKDMTITLEAADSESEKSRVEARMSVGGTLTIQLPFQAGTGYSWALTSISSDLKMMSQTTRSLSEDGRSGGPMLAVYVLECLSADSAQTARFELSRPWETDSAPVRELVLLVNGTNTHSE